MFQMDLTLSAREGMKDKCRDTEKLELVKFGSQMEEPPCPQIPSRFIKYR